MGEKLICKEKRCTGRKVTLREKLHCEKGYTIRKSLGEKLNYGKNVRLVTCWIQHPWWTYALEGKVCPF